MKLGGAGRCPVRLDMLLAVLFYAYLGGLRASRKIEKRCREDVAFIVLSGLGYPDHVTLARFRAANDAVMDDLFETPSSTKPNLNPPPNPTLQDDNDGLARRARPSFNTSHPVTWRRKEINSVLLNLCGLRSRRPRCTSHPGRGSCGRVRPGHCRPRR
jgi:hypothetical protein